VKGDKVKIDAASNKKGAPPVAMRVNRSARVKGAKG